MRIEKMQCNHISQPLGFEMGQAVLSWVTVSEEGAFQSKARVEIALDPEMNRIVYDSGERAEISGIAHEVELAWMPRTRYFWRVTVWTDTGKRIGSVISWFETGKMEEVWMGQWITAEPSVSHPEFRKTFILDRLPVTARLYASGIGLYEADINGLKAGEEFLTPHFNAYDQWLQVQTYDVTSLLKQGENHMGAILGNGWALGRIGMDGGREHVYADRYAFLAELVMEMEDGSLIRIGTDSSWQTRPSYITGSGIYDGETQDANLRTPGPEASNGWSAALLTEKPVTGRLQDRYSLPVVCKEKRKAEQVIVTKNGDVILDMGQNMVGWLVFTADIPKGQQVTLEFGEIMQNGEFYRGNLRTAEQKFTYISNGEQALVRPHFTYFGFRYVRVTGFEYMNEDEIEGWVLYSDMEQSGEVETSHPLVNRLFENALWGQKGNFVDVPTDCPQRDERLGWTGDAQVFAQTASFNMNTAAFFRKYLVDLDYEQKKQNGAVPTVIPKISEDMGASSAAWGDAAAIIPWQQYVQYGDPSILKQQWESMRSWVEYIRGRAGNSHLWINDFHFGDWLAMDSATGSLHGGTLIDLIATAYYAYSTRIVAKAAGVLGLQEEERKYGELFENIKQAFLNEFVSPNGRIVSVTQTAHILPLYVGLIPEKWEKGVVGTLVKLIVDAGYKLQTGFVGTPFLCKILTRYGYNDLAYKLLLSEELPGWLYPVKMGATTIWERWDSVQPDGTISENGMNSLNHYSYGSIADWMYQNMAGIQPMESHPGYREFVLAPRPNGRLRHAEARYDSPTGAIRSGWSIAEDGRVKLAFTVPFNTVAHVELPDCKAGSIECETKDQLHGLREEGTSCRFELQAGTYRISYMPTVSYLQRYNTYSDLRDLISDPEREELVRRHIPGLDRIKGIVYGVKLANMRAMPFITGLKEDQLNALDDELERYYNSRNTAAAAR